MLSEITGTEIGHSDWFKELTLKIMDASEKIINLPLTAQQQIDLGKEIYYCAEELNNNYSKINSGAEKVQKLINKFWDDLEKL